MLKVPPGVQDVLPHSELWPHHQLWTLATLAWKLRSTSWPFCLALNSPEIRKKINKAFGYGKVKPHQFES